MASSDGILCRTHPIIALEVLDYPEQLLVTGIKTGECPVCPVSRHDLGDPACVCGFREMEEVLQAMDILNQGLGAMAFKKACEDAGIKPIQNPFWIKLPFVNIFRSIAPDILHQLYQGIIKHVSGWLKLACGEAEIDARCRRLPPNHNLRLFMKGISHLSCVSGTEHNQISCFLLGIILDVCLANSLSPVRLVRAVRGILDFLYIAQFLIHSDETLDDLDNALQLFHDNKGIFLDLDIQQGFNLPKLHFLSHYRRAIVLYKTTNNYNTEYMEHLHINLAKDAYHSTNRKDEFSQMTTWLER
ncbi:hypothetical protein EV421DRAFT_1744043 [Armillaria borealis]|uniref:Uncharacterized protein n=1 Tax=Armillaria borealis TaxID=47425 RepID=A0AA39MEE4_9AGAR|nr:hypothetical protein EV421DRAFT_1744043 [Armillaria borealis]